MSEQPDYVRESSSSSVSSTIQDNGDDVTIGSILAEENHRVDRSLGKRLSHLGSIPHTPRVNGEIPDVDNATLDHERLLERLSTYGLAELQVEGDGNCQFRALADQFFRNPDHHKHVRKAVIKQLKQFQKFYENYVPMDYRTYLKTMKRSGEWGDHLTLQAAADRFGAKICLVTSFRDTILIEIVPKDNRWSQVLWLSSGVKCTTTLCMELMIFQLGHPGESTGFSSDDTYTQFHDTGISHVRNMLPR